MLNQLISDKIPRQTGLSAATPAAPYLGSRLRVGGCCCRASIQRSIQPSLQAERASSSVARPARIVSSGSAAAGRRCSSVGSAFVIAVHNFTQVVLAPVIASTSQSMTDCNHCCSVDCPSKSFLAFAHVPRALARCSMVHLTKVIQVLLRWPLLSAGPARRSPHGRVGPGLWVKQGIAPPAAAAPLLPTSTDNNEF